MNDRLMECRACGKQESQHVGKCPQFGSLTANRKTFMMLFYIGMVMAAIYFIATLSFIN